MDNFTLFLIFAGFIGVAGFGALAYVLLGNTAPRGQSDMRGLMAGAGGTDLVQGIIMVVAALLVLAVGVILRSRALPV